MSDDAHAPALDRIRVYPITARDGVDVDAATLAPGGGLAPDREFALLDADGAYVNGKNERRIHRVRAEFDLGARTVALDAPHDDDAPAAESFHLDDDRDALADWVGAFLGYDVRLVGERAGGYPDDTELSGPTVLATGTLREVASWYDGLDVDSVRRRLRPNLELARTGSSPTAASASGSAWATPTSSASTPASGVPSPHATPTRAKSTPTSAPALSRSARRRCRRGAAATASTTPSG